MLTEHIRKFCQGSPGPLPRSACGPGYEATSFPGLHVLLLPLATKAGRGDLGMRLGVHDVVMFIVLQ